MTRRIGLSVVEQRAIEVLIEQGPVISSEVGYAVWPERRFKNPQGAGFAGGTLMARMRRRGLVHLKWVRGACGGLHPRGWVATAKARKAIS